MLDYTRGLWLPGYTTVTNNFVYDYSICTTKPIATTPGHTITWSNSGSFTWDLQTQIWLNANLKAISYTNIGSHNGEPTGTRTVVVGNDKVYGLFAFRIDNIDSYTIHDDTDDVYLFQNGKIVNGGGIS